MTLPNMKTHRDLPQSVSFDPDINEWQINEIKKGIIEANAGELIDHNIILNRWSINNKNTLDKNRNSKS